MSVEKLDAGFGKPLQGSYQEKLLPGSPSDSQTVKYEILQGPFNFSDWVISLASFR